MSTLLATLSIAPCSRLLRSRVVPLRLVDLLIGTANLQVFWVLLLGLRWIGIMPVKGVLAVCRLVATGLLSIGGARLESLPVLIVFVGAEGGRSS
jgi:hypothetical protein